MSDNQPDVPATADEATIRSEAHLKAIRSYVGWLLVLTLVGLLLNYALVWIERRATHWRADAGDRPH